MWCDAMHWQGNWSNTEVESTHSLHGFPFGFSIFFPLFLWAYFFSFSLTRFSVCYLSFILSFFASLSHSFPRYMDVFISLAFYVMSFQSQVRNCRIQEYVQYFDVALVVIPLHTPYEMELYCTSTHKLDNFFMWISLLLLVLSFVVIVDVCVCVVFFVILIRIFLFRNWIVSVFSIFDEKLQNTHTQTTNIFYTFSQTKNKQYGEVRRWTFR